MPGNEPGFAVHQRQHGKLHDRITLDQPIEYAQFGRMHDVFRIVQHDRLDDESLAPRIREQRAPERIEAIGLGRGSGLVVDDHPDPVIRSPDSHDGIDRRLVVGINPDVDAVIGMIETGERGRQHRADHRDLVPCGNHDDDSPGQGGGRQMRQRQRARPPVPDSPGDIDKVDQQIVGSADQQSHRGEQRRLPRNRVDCPDDPHASPPTNRAEDVGFWIM